jgi:hypothetical protein
MAHKVTFQIPEREVGNVDIEVIVKKDGNKFGTLKISKGSPCWVPVNHTYGYHLSWFSLDNLFKENGTKR